jgi:hypothetical protein
MVTDPDRNAQPGPASCLWEQTRSGNNPMHIVENDPRPATSVPPSDTPPPIHRATIRVPVKPVVPRSRRAPTRQEIQDAEDGAESHPS